MIEIRIVYLQSFEHGEYPPEEIVWEGEIDSWDDLPSELKDRDGNWLEVVRIEVI